MLPPEIMPPFFLKKVLKIYDNEMDLNLLTLDNEIIFFIQGNARHTALPIFFSESFTRYVWFFQLDVNACKAKRA